MKFDVLTIFPNVVKAYTNESILKRAQKEKKIIVKIHDIRPYSKDKHKKVDDTPYGGGVGMVLRAQPIISAVDKLPKGYSKKPKYKIIVLSAKGKQFTHRLAHDWSRHYDQLILIAGRYEGIDERVKIALRAEEISVGPYVLTDGDVPAMIIISAVSRLIPGVIKLESLQEESRWHGLLSKELKSNLLEYPHYTRPEKLTYKGKTYRVPKVLLSGDHKKIAQWREKHRRAS